MPARSKAQQRLFGMVRAVQKGDMEAPSSDIADVARSISKSDARDFAKTKHKNLPERKEAMDGIKQSVTGRKWDDNRFEKVVGALGKVKVPKVKKPKTEKSEMDKQSASAEYMRPVFDAVQKGKWSPQATAGVGELAGRGLHSGINLMPLGALAGGVYGAGKAPDGQKLRGAAQGVLPGAGAGLGLGVGAMGGSGLGAALGLLLAKKLKVDPRLASTITAGSTLTGAGLGGVTGLLAGKGLGKAIQKPILGETVDRAAPEAAR